MIQVLLPHFIISLLLSPRFVSHRVSSIVFASYCDSIISLNRRTDKGIPADDPRFYLAKSRTEHNRRQIRSSAERWLRARCTKTPCVMQCFIRHGNYERYLSFPYNNTVLAQTISRVCVIIGAQLVTTKFDKTCHTHAGCLNNASRAFPDFASSCIPPLREYLPSRLSTEKKCLIGRSLYPPRVANSIRSVKCPSFCRWNLARRDFHHHSVVSRCEFSRRSRCYRHRDRAFGGRERGGKTSASLPSRVFAMQRTRPIKARFWRDSISILGSIAETISLSAKHFAGCLLLVCMFIGYFYLCRNALVEN